VITAIDTSVLLDVFLADERFGPRSREAVRRCAAEGCLVACGPVWAEIAAAFADAEAAGEAMGRLGVDFVPCGREAALAAGGAWRKYRAGGGKRGRVIADFLIGAHAAHHADRLLTRDRGFHRAYFRGVALVEPSND
jgi:predicted nucleic acid-binding protein